MNRILSVLFLSYLATACVASDSADSAPSAAKGAGGAPSSQPTSPGDTPPETELEPTYTAHVATGKYVWSANPKSNRVAYLDGTDGSVRLTDAGDGPTYLAAVGDANGQSDTALVLNVRSQDATLMRVSGTGFQTKQIPTPAGGNAWAVSPDGAYAIAWTRADLLPGSASDLEGYQRISLLHLTPGAETSSDLSVGFRPLAIVFSKDSQQAYVVSKDGVSTLALASARVTKTTPLPHELGAQPTLTDVLLTSDGSTLFAREATTGSVVAFSFVAGTQQVLSLPGKATDIDLDSTGQRVVAVLRDVNRVALVSVPVNGSTPLATWPLNAQPAAGSVSVSGTGNIGFFYTNAVPSRTITLAPFGVVDPVLRTLLLRANVASVFPAPKGDFALVLHGEIPDGITEPTVKAAISYVPGNPEQPPTLVGLTGVPQSLAYSADASRALVVTNINDTFRGNLINLSGFTNIEILLPSTPISVGVLAGINKGYVLQKHGLGRVTLIDFATGKSKTITGFELAAQVVQGE